MVLSELTALIVAMGSLTTPIAGVIGAWLYMRDRDKQRKALSSACPTCTPLLKPLETPKSTPLLMLCVFAYCAGQFCRPEVRLQFAYLISGYVEPMVATCGSECTGKAGCKCAPDCKCVGAERKPELRPNEIKIPESPAKMKKARRSSSLADAQIPLAGEPWGWFIEPVSSGVLRSNAIF